MLTLLATVSIPPAKIASSLMQTLLIGAKTMTDDTNSDDAEFEKWIQEYINSNYEDLYEKFQWDKENGLL
jgi:hypothetical protein